MTFARIVACPLDDLRAMRDVEEILTTLAAVTPGEAAKAMAWVTERSDREAPFDGAFEVAEARKELAEYYVRFGVADGPETARQLIRRMEDSAKERGVAG